MFKSSLHWINLPCIFQPQPILCSSYSLCIRCTKIAQTEAKIRPGPQDRLGHSFSIKLMMANDVKVVMSSILQFTPHQRIVHIKSKLFVSHAMPQDSKAPLPEKGHWDEGGTGEMICWWWFRLGVFVSTVLSWQTVAIVESQWHLLGIVLNEHNPNSTKVRLSWFDRLVSNLGLASKVNTIGLVGSMPIWLVYRSIFNNYVIQKRVGVQPCASDGLFGATWYQREVTKKSCLLLELVGCVTIISWMAEQPWNFIGWVTPQIIVHVLPEGMVSQCMILIIWL